MQSFVYMRRVRAVYWLKSKTLKMLRIHALLGVVCSSGLAPMTYHKLVGCVAKVTETACVPHSLSFSHTFFFSQTKVMKY